VTWHLTRVVLMCAINIHSINCCSRRPSYFQANEPILRDLSEYITKVGDYPVARGGFGEIWKCLYQTPGGSVKARLHSISMQLSKVNVLAGRGESITGVRC